MTSKVACCRRGVCNHDAAVGSCFGLSVSGHPSQRSLWRCALTRALWVTFIVLAHEAYAVVSYEVHDLGTLGGPWSRSWSINAAGQIVGAAYTDALVEQAVLWPQGGLAIPLTDSSDCTSRAHAINDQDVVVGYRDLGNGCLRASSWDNGREIELAGLGGSCSVAWDINGSGDIVGWSYNDSGHLRATLWRDGLADELATPLDGYSIAYGINDDRVAVGVAAGPTDQDMATMWSDGQARALGILPGGSWSVARAINDNGQVVLWADTADGCNHACLWREGGIIDLGTFGGNDSWAYDLNASGHVVGWSEAYDGTYQAFLYDQMQMHNLGTLGGLFSAAYGINDLGQIVGVAQTSSGQMHAALWLPVPEPVALYLMVAGSLVIYKRGSHRKKLVIISSFWV